MKKVCYINCDKKYIDKNNEKLKFFEVVVNNIGMSEIEKIEYLYQNGGFIIDGNLELLDDIVNFTNNDLFLSFEDHSVLSNKLFYVKEKNDIRLKNILDVMKKESLSIEQAINKLYKIDISSNYDTTLKLEDNFFIYSYDYFFPVDYNMTNKNFTENTVAIYNINEKKYNKKKKKYFLKYGKGYNYIYTLIQVLKLKAGRKKYNFSTKIGINKNVKEANKKLDEAIEIFNEKYKNVNYIVIYHPNWLGVSNATKELFENLLPLEEIYDKNKMYKLAMQIVNSKVKQVIFSAFADGWDMFAKELKKLSSDIKIKCYYHGSNSQVIDEINWRNNVNVIKLHKEGIIDVFATCKESLIEFYKNQGYKTTLIENNVNLQSEVLKKIKTKNLNKNIDLNNLKIGLYAAGMDWRKNMFNQIAAASLCKNCRLDIVPMNIEGQVFASKNNVKMSGVSKSVSREDVLLKMSENDINLYVTFSECAPMVPIESMEMGVICLTGNNHHYFKGTELEKYLVIDREDDVIAIKEKILYAIENKGKIFELYKKWKKKHDDVVIKNRDLFLEM